MTLNTVILFKSRAEMSAVSRKYIRNQIALACMTVVMAFSVVLIDVLFDLFQNRKPIHTFLADHFWLATLIAFLLLCAVDRTAFIQREFWAVGRAYWIARGYEKGEGNIKRGVEAGSVKMVSKGIKQLATFEPNFSDMPDYQEILATGRSWLRSHDGSDQ